MVGTRSVLWHRIDGLGHCHTKERKVKRKLTFEQATPRYIHRFTCDHVPAWALLRRVDGTFYAPQYASDRQWYDHTKFNGEAGYFGVANDCYSTGQTWPLGVALSAPYRKG